jgi:molybdopterin converting factor small subunit
MAIRILIPTALRSFTDSQPSVEVDGQTVGEVLSRLTERYVELRRHLYDDHGKLRNFVNVYVNDEDARYLQREGTPLRDNDVVSIVPSIAGGVERGSVSAVELSPEELQRYNRHLIMPEVGVDGQKRLKSSSVLLVGAGGLGAPLGMYLAPPASAGSGSWTTTPSTSRTCSGRSRTRPRTSGGGSSRWRASACTESTRMSRSRPTRCGWIPPTRSTSSVATT